MSAAHGVANEQPDGNDHGERQQHLREVERVAVRDDRTIVRHFHPADFHATLLSPAPAQIWRSARWTTGVRLGHHERVSHGVTHRSSAPKSRGRWSRPWVIVGGAVAVAALGIATWLTISLLSSPLNGWTISITNGCGFAVYADDGRDGIRIEADETIRWSGASESGEKVIRLWRFEPGDGPVDAEAVVKLRGDSLLSGETCPVEQ